VLFTSHQYLKLKIIIQNSQLQNPNLVIHTLSSPFIVSRKTLHPSRFAILLLPMMFASAQTVASVHDGLCLTRGHTWPSLTQTTDKRCRYQRRIGLQNIGTFSYCPARTRASRFPKPSSQDELLQLACEDN
jgi:hypothetical protein